MDDQFPFLEEAIKWLLGKPESREVLENFLKEHKEELSEKQVSLILEALKSK